MYEQPFNPYASNLAAVKNYFKQPRILVMAIIYVLTAIAGVVQSLAASASIPGFLSDLMNYFDKLGIDSGISAAELDSVNQALSQSTIISITPSLVISAAVSVLIATAFFIIYFKSRNEAAESTPITGVTILYVLSIISLIFVIIGVIGMVVIAAFLITFSGRVASSVGDSKPIDIGNGYQMTFNGPALGTAFIILGIILLIISAFLMFTAINKFRYYSSVKSSISSVSLQSGGAKPYGVMCVISAVFTASSVLGSLGSLILAGSSGFSSLTGLLLATLLVNALSFATLVVDAKIALGYKKYIDQNMYGYNEPANGGSDPSGTSLPEYNRQDVTPGTEQNPYFAPQPKTYNDGFSQSSQQAERPSVPAVCPNCGAPTEGGPFCGNCGTKL